MIKESELKNPNVFIYKNWCDKNTSYHYVLCKRYPRSRTKKNQATYYWSSYNYEYSKATAEKAQVHYKCDILLEKPEWM